MSLHLIESRAPSRVMLLRRPGANVVSIGMHAVLITLAIMATRTTPVFATRPALEHVVYTEPVPPPSLPVSPTPPAPSPQNSWGIRPEIQANFVVPPIDIPTVIPEISVAVPHDIDAINIVRRQGGTSSGVPGGTGYGAAGGDEVRDERHVDRAVMLLPGMPIPRYPEALRVAGIHDSLIASFVVDTTGRMESGSLTFAGSPHVAFATAVRDALLKARFKPAEADGRKVRQYVQQPFVFSLSR